MKEDSTLYPTRVDENTPIFDDDFDNDLLLPEYPVISAAIRGLLIIAGFILIIGICCYVIELIIRLFAMYLG